MSLRNHLHRLGRKGGISLVLALMLLMTAVTGALASAPSAETAQQGVQIPRLVVVLNENGTVTGLGIVVSEDVQINFAEPDLDFLGRVLGLNLKTQMLDPGTTSALLDAGIQHVEVQTGSEGVAMYANGQFLLGLQWGAKDVFDDIVRLGQAAGMPFATTIKLVPTVGTDLLLQLPTPSAVEAIAPRPVNSALSFPAVGAEGRPSIVLRVSGGYNRAGKATLLGMPVDTWGGMLGVNLSVLNLSPVALRVFQDAGVGSLGLQLGGLGAAFLLDDEAAATIVLGERESLDIAQRLARQFQMPFADLVPLVGRTRNLDVRFTVQLPAAR